MSKAKATRPKAKRPIYTPQVEAKCIGCKATRWIGTGEVARGDMPTCDKCFNVMVSTGKARTVKAES